MRALYCLLSTLVVAIGVLLPACFNNSKNGNSADAGVYPDVLAPGVNIGDAGTKRFTVGGTVEGLRGSGLVLYGEGPSLTIGGTTYKLAEPLAVAAGGNGANVSFVFQTAVPTGFPYTITVQTQPSNPAQNCMVTAGGTGKVGIGDVHNVVVTCMTDAYVIGGNVTGVQGGQKVILEDNGGDLISVNGNTSFMFPHAIPSGGTYAVTVVGSPLFPAETCRVSMGTGTVTSANIINVLVNCNPNIYNVGGTVVGLTGTGLVVTDNASDNRSITANGTFMFTSPVTSGSPFAVTISTQPSGQTCTVSGASGTVASSDVTSVVVNCGTNTFTVGGQVNGLAGAGLVLQGTTGTLNVGGDGAFAFPTPQADGTGYSVQVSTQPSNPSQTCTITGGSGTIMSADVNSVQVSCSTASFNVGGQVSGLLSGSTVVLQNNGGDDVMVNGNIGFIFPTPLASGAAFNVTVGTQPSSGSTDGGGVQQQCDVMGGTGVIGMADVTNVMVVCNPIYPLSVLVWFDITGADVGDPHGGDTVTVSDGVDGPITVGAAVGTFGNESFTFPTPLPAGSYTVTDQVSGSCGAVTCQLQASVCPFVGALVRGAPPTTAIPAPGPFTVTLPQSSTLYLCCSGNVICCNDPCSSTSCATSFTTGYCDPACGSENTSSCTCNRDGC
jgi:hypothetical protein